MHNRQAITFKLLWKSLCDFDLWPIYAIGLTFGIPAGPPDQYLTLTLRQLGFDTFNSNLLSIPAQVGTTINVCTAKPTIFYSNHEADVNHDLHIRADQSTRVSGYFRSTLVSPMRGSNGHDTQCGFKMGAVCACHRLVVLSDATSNAGRLVQSKFKYSSHSNCGRCLIQYVRTATSDYLLEHLS
jgi:hypothetical protein